MKRKPCKGCGTTEEKDFEYPKDVACVKCNEDAEEINKEIEEEER